MPASSRVFVTSTSSRRAATWHGGLSPTVFVMIRHQRFLQGRQDSDCCEDNGRQTHRRPGLCEITCSDASQFRTWSAVEVHQAVDLLAAAADRVSAGTLTKARYEQIEQAHGLNLNKHGLLAAVDLRLSLNTRVLQRHRCAQSINTRPTTKRINTAMHITRMNSQAERQTATRTIRLSSAVSSNQRRANTQ
jgi:hypothetical protein